jgi:tRNA-(ms[2]io[6]A)-hydroxylase
MTLLIEPRQCHEQTERRSALDSSKPRDSGAPDAHGDSARSDSAGNDNDSNDIASTGTENSWVTAEPKLELALKLATSPAWVNTVMNDFDSFLIDHAACERKAAGMALSLCTHYPDRPELVRGMSALAVEELMHYREVLKWMSKRQLIQTPDEKDPYINGLLKWQGKGKQVYLRDRLLLAAIIERRGHERFGLVAEALPTGGLKQFYDRITRSEDRHHELFLRLAEQYCLSPEAEDKISLPDRLDQLLTAEADIVANLPIRAKLH